MRFILIAFVLLLVFFLSSRVKLFHTEDSSTPSSVLHIWEFAVAICRKKLPQEFAVAICCQNLPWEFAVAIFRGFFVYTSQSFFVYVSKSCLYGGKPFLYVCKTFWFVRFSLLTVLLLVIVVAVMGHRPYQGSAIREPKIPSSLILSFHFSLILIKQYRALKPLRNPYWYFVRF